MFSFINRVLSQEKEVGVIAEISFNDQIKGIGLILYREFENYENF